MRRQKSRTLIRRLSGRLIAAVELGYYKFPICDFWNFILSLMLACIMGVCICAFHYVLLVNQSVAACANYDRDRVLCRPLLHLSDILFYGNYRDSQVKVAQR
jgi:hypothetical protein